MSRWSGWVSTFITVLFHPPGDPGAACNEPQGQVQVAAHMENSVPGVSDGVSTMSDSDWHVISDTQAAPSFPTQFSLNPRRPPDLTVSLQTTGNPLSVPPVSHPGMINSLPMTSRAKCKPAAPPNVMESNRPRSLMFDTTSQTACRPNPHCYEHHPPAPGEKRVKLAHDGAGSSSATGLLRTKTPSSIPFLVNLWTSILVSLGSVSKVFADIGNHANFSSLASIILDAFAASTLHRYLTCISKFLTWCRESDLPLPSISAATVLDVLQGGSRNSGMKGSTVLKSLQWCRKQADVQAWSFLDSPLIQGWMKSKVPADRRESLPLPLYVVVQWERRLLQANIPLREIIIIGGFLLMIWTGLRFADLQRVTITSVVCSASEIRGISWRTKTCSKGQPWGARASGFLSVGSVTWLSKFVCAWDAVLAAQSEGDLDFVIPQFQDGSVAQPYQPMSYPSALHWFRLFLTIPWKSSSLTASIDCGSYSIHGMKATLLSWSSQLCHQGIITEEMRRQQGHHRPIQHSVSLYSRDDVNGQLELQRRLITQVVSGWRPITPQHRGAQMPASEPEVVMERFRKDLGEIQLSVLHWNISGSHVTVPQVESSSASDSAGSSSTSSSSASSTAVQPPAQKLSEHLIAIGVHRLVHHAMIACTTNTTGVSCWNDVPVQTACGRRFTSKRITLHEVFTPPEGKCCMHRGCQQWLHPDRE